MNIVSEIPSWDFPIIILIWYTDLDCSYLEPEPFNEGLLSVENYLPLLELNKTRGQIMAQQILRECATFLEVYVILRW